MLYITCLIATLCAPSTDAPGLLAHWTLDNLQAGAMTDAGSGGRHATLRGRAPNAFIRTGLSGNAAFFDTGRNYLEVPHSPALDLTTDFTVSCAILPFSVDGFRTILWKGDRTRTPEAVNYYLDLRDGKVELKAKDAEGRWTVHATGPCVMPDAWHWIRVSYADGVCRIWVNGDPKPVASAEDGRLTGGLVPNTGNLYIGAGANSSGIAYAFLGLIDDVRIMRGVADAPTDAERAAWTKAVADYPRRVVADRVGPVRDRVKSAQTFSDNDRALLRELDAQCAKALGQDTAGAAATLAEVEQQLDRVAFRTFYARNAPPDAPFLVVPMRTSDRLVKERRFFAHVANAADDVHLESARNEYEGFQLAVIPEPDRRITDLTVSVSDLKTSTGHTLDASRVEYGWVRPIMTEMPDIPVDFGGAIPDAIIEGEAPPAIASYDFEALFFRVFTSMDAAPGDYRGTVTIATNGYARTIALNLRVHRFTLPERTPLRMAFSFYEHFYRGWYGLDEVSPDRQRTLYEFLLKYRIPPNDIYSHLETYPSLPHLKTLGDRATFFTFSTGLPSPGLRTPEAIAESVDRIAGVYQELSDAGLLRDAYVYCFDEISYNRESIPVAREFVGALRKRLPDVRVMQTSFPDEEIHDIFNVWCPLIHDFEKPGHRRVLEDLRADGNEIWWYLADMPKHPIPNLFLDYPPFDARILGVLSHMYDVEGVLYWSINREWKTNVDEQPRWPQGEWKAHIYHAHTGVRKRKNGMGNLIYPGPGGGLYPSLRLENLRDGIEDHAYLTLLREVARNAEEGDSAQRLQALLDVPEDVATAANAFNPDPQALLDYRRAVAHALDELER